MEFLATISESLGLSLQTLFVLLIGVTVFLLGLAGSAAFTSASNPLRRRLSTAAGVEQDVSPRRDGKPRRDFSRFIAPVARYVIPQDAKERTKIEESLIHAGFRSEKALPYFFGLKAILAIGLPLLVFIGTAWLPEWTMTNMIYSVVIAAFIGVAGPNGVLERLKEKRLKKLRNGFPDALDLLVVCVEAGLGLGPAIDRVARDLDVSHPELAEELRLVNVEMRAGVERPTALKNLADRSGLPDIRGLVGLLVQTMRFGTSIADALRVYSEEFRDKRMQAAEEQAAKIGTKLIFPLVVCLFPAFFIVAVGPAALRMITVFNTL